MKGIRPCPYCGGEVEVVKLAHKKDEPNDVYRIECLSCRALVPRGLGFNGESKKEIKERIKQYNDFIAKHEVHFFIPTKRLPNRY